jgi:hypothetical protein
MGALRAAELAPFGMVGVGRVYEWVSAGEVDDADVALLHGDAEAAHVALTVPFVNVKHAAERAVAARVLRRAEARRLVDEARRTFYQERTWGGLLRAMKQWWKPADFARWRELERAGLPDVKAEDARACLQVARLFAERGGGRASANVRLNVSPIPSSAVRHRRLMEGMAGEAPSAEVLKKLWRRDDAGELVRAGFQRSVLAALARAMGLSVPEANGGEVGHLAEEVGLEELVLENLPRLIPDAPSADEALASEARHRRLWSP